MQATPTDRLGSWGANAVGQLGDGTDDPANTIIRGTGLTGVVQVATGSYHTLALKSDGTVWAWGLNYYGQLGDGTFIDHYAPAQVSGLTNVTYIATGAFHSLAVKSDGTVWAWGNNYDGELGDGTSTDRKSPVKVKFLSGVSKVAAGIEHSLALKTDGTVSAWGCNCAGQLGDGTNDSSFIAIDVITVSGITQIVAGGGHSLALKSDGSVYSWGNNLEGELGDGSNDDSNAPLLISSLTGIRYIAAGASHSLALKSDGTVYTWGFNADGELGNGTNDDSNTPAALTGITGVTQLAGGGSHTLALKSDGTVLAWGSNKYGQLGDGTTLDSNAPITVAGATGVVQVSAGGIHSFVRLQPGIQTSLNFTYSNLTTRYFEDKPIDVSLKETTSGNAIANATIHFLLNGFTLGTATTDSDGKTTFTQYIDPALLTGAHTLVAVYSGNADNEGSNVFTNLTINKASTSLSVANASGVLGETINLIAQLKLPFDDSNIQGQTLTFKIGTTALGTAVTDANGVATLSYKIDTPAVGGNNNLDVSFAGDDVYASSTRTGILTVNKIDTVISVQNRTGVFGETVNLVAQLHRPLDGSNIAGKTLTFKIGTSTLGTAVTDASGVATLSYKIDPPAVAGANNLDVSFAGDAGYKASTRTGTLTVNSISSSLSVSNASGRFGMTLSLRAQLQRPLDGANIAGKTISFFVDGSSVGTATTNSSGVATLSYLVDEPLTLGNHPLAVSFAGGGGYTASNRTGTLSVLQANSYVGQINTYSKLNRTDTLRATLIRTTDNHAIVGRTVRFFVNSTEVGTAVTNSSGVATYSYTNSTLPVGVYPLKVVFDGDTDYITSTYTAASLIVQ